MDSKAYGMYEKMFARGYRVAFQPILSKSETKVGVEALIRKQDNAGSLISAEGVFALPENSSSLNRSSIDFFAAYSALRFAVDNPQFSVVNFNASMLSLTNQGYVQALKHLSQQGVPSSIVLEITESESIAPGCYFQLAETIVELRQCGFRIALDDFGCGHACLRLLRLLSPSIVKFSRNVIIEIANSLKNNDRQALEVMTIFIDNLLQQRGIEIICEGIETQDELAIAQLLSADYYQGFYFGMPLIEQHHSVLEYAEQTA